jgi:hypothetical protein
MLVHNNSRVMWMRLRPIAGFSPDAIGSAQNSEDDVLPQMITVHD